MISIPKPKNNEMHGTPQGYLSCIVAGRIAASVDVKRRPVGARDLNAVIRPWERVLICDRKVLRKFYSR